MGRSASAFMNSFFAEIPDLDELQGLVSGHGAAVATCTALLIALDQPTLASFASVGGGGGALY